MASSVRCTCPHGRMMDAFDLDTIVWMTEREAATSEYATEMVEWEREHPRPQLRDYMTLQGQF
jgi:hypothetical protein